MRAGDANVSGPDAYDATGWLIPVHVPARAGPDTPSVGLVERSEPCRRGSPCPGTPRIAAISALLARLVPARDGPDGGRQSPVFAADQHV